MEKLTCGGATRENGAVEVWSVGFIPGVGKRVDFRTKRDDKEIDPKFGVGVIYETDAKIYGDFLLETTLVLVAAEILTDRVRYVLTVEDELMAKDKVERSYWLEEDDLRVPKLSGRSRIELGKGFWGMLAAGIVKEIGIDNLFELKLD